LAKILEAEITILGVIERADLVMQVEKAVEEVRSLLKEEGVAFQTLTRRGRARAELARQTREKRYDLVVVGSLGRAWWTRFLRGPTWRRILRAVESSVLIVRVERPFSLEKALVCSGGLSHADQVTRFGGKILQMAGARATLMHVVDPLTMEHLAHKRRISLEEFAQLDIPQSRHFLIEYDILRGMGVEVEMKLRHGFATEEILQEVGEGGYDLAVMGSTQIATGLRHYFVGSITDKVVENAPCPVLVVR
jgi:nucleotide-binding universal stress UspA family protein